MAKRSFSATTWTPTATADTTGLGSGNYQAITGGNSTQFIMYYEVYMGGQAGASSPTIMVFSRDSTVGLSTSALGAGYTDAALDPFTSALVVAPVSYVSAAAGQPPQRSATAHLLNLSFNAFGGIIRWVAAPGEEPRQYGNSSTLGETSLSAFTGGTAGLMGSHIDLNWGICFN